MHKSYNGMSLLQRFWILLIRKKWSISSPNKRKNSWYLLEISPWNWDKYYPRFISVASFSKEWREPGGQFGGQFEGDSLTNHHHLGGFPNRLRSKSLRWWLVAFPKDPLNNKQTCYNMVDITKQQLDILDPCWWTKHPDIYIYISTCMRSGFIMVYSCLL